MSQQINLFNPIFLSQRKLFSALAMIQALGLILLGLIALSVFSFYRLEDTKNLADAMSNRLKRMQDQIVVLIEKKAPEKLNPELVAQIAVAESELTSSQQILDFIQDDAARTGKGYAEYFRALARRSSDGVWLTGFSLGSGGKTMEIAGRALQPALVPSYLSGLRTEKIFEGDAFRSIAMNMPASATVPAAAASADSPKANVIKSDSPSYIEFRLSSAEAGTGQGSIVTRAP